MCLMGWSNVTIERLRCPKIASLFSHGKNCEKRKVSLAPIHKGMARLSRPGRFARPKVVTRPSTNRVRCRVTSLIKTTSLPLSRTTMLLKWYKEVLLCGGGCSGLRETTKGNEGHWLIESRLYVPPDTKQVIFETFFLASLLICFNTWSLPCRLQSMDSATARNETASSV